MKIIFLKLSEIYLKKRNLPYFLELIKQNICFVLKQFSGTLLFRSNRFYINNFKVEQEVELVNVLKRIPGIYAVLIGYELVNDLESIIKEAATFLIKKNIKSYKVEVRRIEKIGDLTSSSLKKKIGSIIRCIFKKS